MQFEIKYPTIGISKNAIIEVYASENDLTICTQTGLKNGFYQGLELIDSNLIEFRVKNAIKIGGVGPFWGYNFFLIRKLRLSWYLMVKQSN